MQEKLMKFTPNHRFLRSVTTTQIYCKNLFCQFSSLTNRVDIIYFDYTKNYNYMKSLLSQQQTVEVFIFPL